MFKLRPSLPLILSQMMFEITLEKEREVVKAVLSLECRVHGVSNNDRAFYLIHKTKYYPHQKELQNLYI